MNIADFYCYLSIETNSVTAIRWQAMRYWTLKVISTFENPLWKGFSSSWWILSNISHPPPNLHDLGPWLPWLLQQGWDIDTRQAVLESSIECDCGGYTTMNCKTKKPESVLKCKSLWEIPNQITRLLIVLSVKSGWADRENSGTNSKRCSLEYLRDTKVKEEAMMHGVESSLTWRVGNCPNHWVDVWAPEC